MGPKNPRSTVLTRQEEAMILALRKHTLLPLDDCLYALQDTIAHLMRSSLHRCWQRHGISRLPDMVGDKAKKKKFKTYPIGYVHIDIAEVRTEEGKLQLFVAIDRTCQFAKVNRPWANGQIERMNQTLKEATFKRYHYDNQTQFQAHFKDFISAYNNARRLKILKGGLAV